MPPSNFKRKWIKLYIDECLTGTIREDLLPEERGVWYDFLLLAGRNRPPGAISANETTPISPRRLASLLNISVQLIARATKKFEESGRVRIDESGILHIANWDKYQFTDYDRQKPFRQKYQMEKSSLKNTMPEDGPHGYLHDPNGALTDAEAYGEDYDLVNDIIREEPIEVHDAAIEAKRVKKPTRQ